MKIRPGSKKDKEMEKKYHIRPGSREDKMMENGAVTADMRGGMMPMAQTPMNNNSVVNDTSHIPVVNLHKKHHDLIKKHQARRK